jgi:hypothetical protein
MGGVCRVFTENAAPVLAASGADLWPLFLVVAYYVSAYLAERARRRSVSRTTPRHPPQGG